MEDLEPGLTDEGKEKEWDKIEAKQWRDRTDTELEDNWVGTHVREDRQETDWIMHTELHQDYEPQELEEARKLV